VFLVRQATEVHEDAFVEQSSLITAEAEAWARRAHHNFEKMSVQQVVKFLDSIKIPKVTTPNVAIPKKAGVVIRVQHARLHALKKQLAKKLKKARTAAAKAKVQSHLKALEHSITAREFAKMSIGQMLKYVKTHNVKTDIVHEALVIKGVKPTQAKKHTSALKKTAAKLKKAAIRNAVKLRLLRAQINNAKTKEARRAARKALAKVSARVAKNKKALLKTMKKITKAHKNRRSALKGKIDTLKAKIAKLKAQISAKKVALSAAVTDSQKSELKGKIAALQAKLDALLGKKKAAAKKLAAARKARRASLKKRVGALKNKLAAQKKALQKRTQKIAALKQKVASCKKNCAALKAKLTASKLAAKALRKQVGAAFKAISNQRKKLTAARAARKQELKASVKRAAASLAELRRQIRDIRYQMARTNNGDSKAQLQAKLDGLIAKVALLEAKLAKRRASLQKVREATVNGLKAQISSLRSQSAWSRNRINYLRWALDRWARWNSWQWRVNVQNEINGNARHIVSCKSQILALKELLRVARQKRILKLKNTVALLKTKIAEKQSSLDETNQAIAASVDAESKKVWVAKATAVQQRINDLRNEKDARQTELDNMRSALVVQFKVCVFVIFSVFASNHLFDTHCPAFVQTLIAKLQSRVSVVKANLAQAVASKAATENEMERASFSIKIDNIKASLTAEQKHLAEAQAYLDEQRAARRARLAAAVSELSTKADAVESIVVQQTAALASAVTSRAARSQLNYLQNKLSGTKQDSARIRAKLSKKKSVLKRLQIARLTRLQTALESLKSRAASLQSRISEWQEALALPATTEMQRDALNVKIDAARAKLAKIASKLVGKQAKLREADRLRRIAAAADVARAQRRVASLESQIRGWNAERKMATTKAIKASFTARLATAADQLAQARTKLSTLQSVLKAMRDAAQKSRAAALDSLKGEVARQASQLNDLRSQLASAQSDEERAQWRRAISRAKVARDAAADRMVSVQRAQKSAKISLAVEKSQNNLEKQQSKLELIKAQLDVAEGDDRKALKAKIAEQQQAVRSARNGVAKQVVRLEESRRRTRAWMARRAAAVDAKLAETKGKIQDLMTSIAAAETPKERLSLQRRVSAAKFALRAQRKKWIQMQEQLVAKRSRAMKRLSKRLRRWRKKSFRMSRKLATWQTMLSALKPSDKGYQALMTKIGDFTVRVGGFQGKIENANQKMDDMRTKQQTARQVLISRLIAHLKTLRTALNRLVQRLGKLRIDLNNAKTDDKRITIKRQIRSLKRALLRLRRRFGRANSRVERFYARRARQLAAKLDGMRARMEAREAKITATKEIMTSASATDIQKFRAQNKLSYLRTELARLIASIGRIDNRLAAARASALKALSSRSANEAKMLSRLEHMSDLMEARADAADSKSAERQWRAAQAIAARDVKNARAANAVTRERLAKAQTVANGALSRRLNELRKWLSARVAKLSALLDKLQNPKLDEDDRATLKKQAAVVRKIVKNLRKQASSARRQQRAAWRAAAKALKARLLALKRGLKRRTAKLAALKARLANETNKQLRTQLKSQQNDLKAAVDKIKTKLQAAKRRLNKMRAARRAAMNNRVNKLNAKMVAATAKLQALMEKAESPLLKASVRSVLQARINKLRARINKLKSRLAAAKLRAKLAKMKAKLAKLAAQLKKLQLALKNATGAEKDALLAKIKKLNSFVAKLHAKAAKYLSKLSKLTKVQLPKLKARKQVRRHRKSRRALPAVKRPEFHVDFSTLDADQLHAALHRAAAEAKSDIAQEKLRLRNAADDLLDGEEAVKYQLNAKRLLRQAASDVEELRRLHSYDEAKRDRASQLSFVSEQQKGDLKSVASRVRIAEQLA
jgi:chromosome segregation ATPase